MEQVRVQCIQSLVVHPVSRLLKVKEIEHAAEVPLEILHERSSWRHLPVKHPSHYDASKAPAQMKR